MAVGILAYGSLSNCPGDEITEAIAGRAQAFTPFPVEFARLSHTRGGAPTLVPFEAGWRVRATVLILNDKIDLSDAKDMLYRRERHRVGSAERYNPPLSETADAIVIEQCVEPQVASAQPILCVKLGSNIAPHLLSGVYLAERAIESVSKAPIGTDGISYLIGMPDVETPLSRAYRDAILSRAGPGGSPCPDTTSRVVSTAISFVLGIVASMLAWLVVARALLPSIVIDEKIDAVKSADGSVRFRFAIRNGRLFRDAVDVSVRVRAAIPIEGRQQPNMTFQVPVDDDWVPVVRSQHYWAKRRGPHYWPQRPVLLLSELPSWVCNRLDVTKGECSLKDILDVPGARVRVVVVAHDSFSSARRVFIRIFYSDHVAWNALSDDPASAS